MRSSDCSSAGAVLPFGVDTAHTHMLNPLPHHDQCMQRLVVHAAGHRYCIQRPVPVVVVKLAKGWRAPLELLKQRAADGHAHVVGRGHPHLPSHGI